MKTPRHFASLLSRYGGIAVIAAGSISLVLAPDAKAAVTNACGSGTPTSQNPFIVYFKDLNTGDQFQCQDKLFTIGNPAGLKATNDYSQNALGGYLSFEWTKIPPADSFYTNDLFGFTAVFQPKVEGSSGTFEYTVAAGTNFILKDVTLDSNVGRFSTGADTTVTKDVYDPSGMPIATLVSVNGDPNPPPPVSLLGNQEVRVVEAWNVQPGDTLRDFENIFRQESTLAPGETAPGPLPLLGAGAAFGFSRRLRSRLLAARRG